MIAKLGTSSIPGLSSDGATLAKVIATISVVLTHSYKLFRYMGVQESKVFYLRGFHAFAACGVLVFFLLSGFFLTFKDDKWDYRKNLKKKLKSLAVPYCLFILIYTLISMVGALALPAFFDDFRGFSVKDWLMHLVGIPFVSAPIYYGPLWFVRDLFILNVLSFALVPIVKRIPGYILISAMIGVYFLPLPQTTRYSIPLFIMGMVLGFKKKIPILKNPVYFSSLFLTAFIVPIVFEGGLAWKISVFLMTASVLFISGNIIDNGTIRRIAKVAIAFSFPVYLLHEYPVTTIMRLLALKHISIPVATAAFFIVPVVVICICVIFIMIWKRLLPRMYALFTGGR